MKFYYFVDKERVRQGPLPIEDLQSYEITPNTLVWCKGMKKWSKAKDVEELAHLFESINNKNESDITSIKCIECGYEVSDGASACPNCGCPIENVTLCSECNQLIPDGVEVCPNCGYPLMKEKEGGEPKEAVEEIKSVYNEEDEDNSRKWLYGIIALLVALIAGGGYWWYSRSDDEREVKQFVEKFAKAVELGDKQTIQQLYPKSDGAESLHVSYYVDSMSIVHPTGNDTIDVKLSHSQSIRLTKDAKKQMYIVSSKGLFDFPKEEIDFAIKTGWINSSLDDAVKAERLKDKEFIPWLEQKAISLMKENVKVVESSIKKGPETSGWGGTAGGMIAYNCNVIVANNNNCDIPANAYLIAIEVKGVDWEWYGPNYETKEGYSEFVDSLTGKLIPPKGTVSFSWIIEEVSGAHSGRTPQKLKCKIVFEPNKDDAIAAYESTGKEYFEYLEWKNSQKKK